LSVKLTHNKKKIVNDPVYGFITIQYELLFDIIEHPWFQRLRRIRQLGLTDYVYPGAQHTRFHHALGAMHLMSLAIESLRSKGHEITDEENLAAQAAILLHDIGHGPFSHALEHSIVNGLNHEELSLLFMRKLNIHFEGKLEMAIAIFTDTYHKKFLHQLLSSQLDVDRLDYLNRDSFYTGVAEGTVGSDRIIKMMEVVNGELVLEEKGIYSIEKFLLARRLMYWQVYLHKTVLAAENLLVNMLKRAKYLAQNGEVVFATKGLNYFLNSTNSTYNENLDEEFIEHFSHLDDYDIFAAAKEWMSHTDTILVELSTRLIERKLFKIRIEDQPFKESEIALLKAQWQLKGNSEEDSFYYIFTGEITNSAYKSGEEKINILLKNGTIRDVRDASDQLRLSVYSESIRKYFLCYPKEIDTIN
jgi:HD superfamily phosphohydrolase